MSLKILVDVNLSPQWVTLLKSHGWDAVAWIDIGNPGAADSEIMAWAKSHQHIVFTHDLDFGTLLALTKAVGPSVLQVRSQNVLPDHLGSIVLAALQQHVEDLIAGALVVVDEKKSRVRVLPF